jgi:hypothetical protein
MTADKRGVSALLLQRQLRLRRYETAWMMLDKFRRAMINLAREPLRGEMEVDDTWVGGTQAGLRGADNSRCGRRHWSSSPQRNEATQPGVLAWRLPELIPFIQQVHQHHFVHRPCASPAAFQRGKNLTEPALLMEAATVREPVPERARKRIRRWPDSCAAR